MLTFRPRLRVCLMLAFMIPTTAFADGCGCHDRGLSDRDTATAEGLAVVCGLGVVALTSPLWLDGGHPYVEGSASTVVGRGRFSAPDEFPQPRDAAVIGGLGGSLAAGVSRLGPDNANGLAVRGEVVAWHNNFDLHDKAPLPGPQSFDATVLALGAHVDSRVSGLPMVFSLGGRLGGAYLNSRASRQDAFAWDAELVAGVGVKLDNHWMLTGQVRGVLLLPGSNDFTVGNGRAVLADVGLRYNF